MEMRVECPRCGGKLEHGLSSKSAGLSFVPPERLRRFLFVDEDLNGRRWLVRLFASRARFCPSHLCRACSLYVVEFGTVLTRPEANRFAASLQPQP